MCYIVECVKNRRIIDITQASMFFINQINNHLKKGGHQSDYHKLDISTVIKAILSGYMVNNQLVFDLFPHFNLF